MKNENSLEDFILFIRDNIGEFKMEINETSLIEDDLGVSGDDADELIQAYAKAYEVDISGFNFSKYFYSEGFIGLFAFLEEPKAKAQITIGDLFLGIKAGKLDDTVIRGQQT